MTYNNSVKGWDPYFDPNSERDQTLTKTEDGLGPINKSTPESRAKALDIIASFAASTSSQTLDNQPLASTSSQTLDNQPAASSQDSVNNNLTDSEIYSAVLVLKKWGFVPENLNPFGSYSTTSDIASDTSTLADTDSSSTSTSDSNIATDITSGSEAEGYDATNSKGKKRVQSEDPENSDLPPTKRKKTD